MAGHAALQEEEWLGRFAQTLESTRLDIETEADLFYTVTTANKLWSGRLADKLLEERKAGHLQPLKRVDVETGFRDIHRPFSSFQNIISCIPPCCCTFPFSGV